jgi:hypothetical protein
MKIRDPEQTNSVENSVKYIGESESKGNFEIAL